MSKIIITADVHCGAKNKLDDCIWALGTIREYAKEHGIETVIVLGDLFHDRVNLNIKVISKVADFLDDTKFKYGQEWAVFPGNHDMFMRHSWGVNSLRPIRRLITLIDDVALIKIDGHKFRIIPFIQREEIYMKVLEHINERASEDEILLTHVGITGAKYNTCFLMQHWGMVNFDDTKFKRVFAGHFHCNQKVDKVYIPGSPLPFRFDEGMVDHGFYELDLDADRVEFININRGESLIGGEAPPDYITIIDDQLADVDVTRKNVRVRLTETKSRDELDRIRNDLESRGAIKVTWMRVEEVETDMAGDGAVMEPSTLLEKYYDHDKPSGLSKQLLLSLNKQVLSEAFDRDPETE
jgi:DNA repair exonuclease SbcCD nuclease subunit